MLEGPTDGTQLTLDRMIALQAEVLSGGGRSLRGLTHFPGLVRGPKRGQGLDFDDLRLYAPGDDVRHIDWNVTARTGRPHTRLYREERERAVTLALDLRPSMLTGTRMLRAVAAGELAGAIAWQAAHDGDRTGAAVWSGQAVEASRPASGDRGALATSRLIAEGFAAVRARPEGAGGSGLDSFVSWLNGAGRPAGAAILLTGLDMPGPGFAAAIAEAGKRRRLALIHVLDAMELQSLPPGRYTVTTGGRQVRTRLDRAAADAALRRMAETRARLHAEIEAGGVPVMTHVAGEPAARALAGLEMRGWL
ncbi:MAG: DUF58 domain-containing protein [Phyllobacteriaceae bacterium]|nr:DUF58 domain-containing protein [Phyllobacteriaceae bacterium]MBA91230.1 DUF58 domain-containing protein [Phyllobacteriaceae bacterium]